MVAHRAAGLAESALRPDGDPIIEPTQPNLTIAAAIPKGDRAEWMVQKLTEVGVSDILLLHCDRSVVRWEGDRAERQLARARRVVKEAAMQSRRVWLPLVSGPVPCAHVLAMADVAIAEPAGVSPSALGWRPATVAIGPEGGFSEAELAAPVARVALGDSVLRIETAAIVAAIRFLM